MNDVNICILNCHRDFFLLSSYIKSLLTPVPDKFGYFVLSICHFGKKPTKEKQRKRFLKFKEESTCLWCVCTNDMILVCRREHLQTVYAVKLQW